MRVAASRTDLRPSSSACWRACLRTKFISSGSSSSAAILTARSRSSIWLTNRSRNTPEQLTTTSTRGRPSSSSGMTSSLFTRPSASGTGRMPTIIITCASDSPYVLMLSVPHRTSAIVSGYLPPLSVLSRSMRRSTTTAADLMAATVGMDCGSSAWMFLPVGSTSGLRMGSPPGPGSTYLPSRPSTRAPSSLSLTICVKQKSKYLNVSASSRRLHPANSVPRSARENGSSYKPIHLEMVVWMLLPMRPSRPVRSLTYSPTSSRLMAVIRCSVSTSASSPRLLPW
mmetsp:Transcript_45111/g.134703  ORF Transcript_45111/g.134703 Transcript_45111/m.134703 type:complete len:284 (+) Transcript_45111:1154-2005(+)